MREAETPHLRAGISRRSRARAAQDFLDPVFATFFEKLGLPNLMRKTDYHRLARLVPAELLDSEVCEKLDLIAATAKRARPTGESGSS